QPGSSWGTSTTRAVDATGSSVLHLQALRLTRHGLVVVTGRVAWCRDCSGSGDRGDHEPNEQQQSKALPDHRYPSFPVSAICPGRQSVCHPVTPGNTGLTLGRIAKKSGIVPVPRPGGSPDIGPRPSRGSEGGTGLASSATRRVDLGKREGRP